MHVGCGERPVMGPLEALFAPRRVAVVGASEREGSLGAIMLANLARFRGEVIPVTRSARRIGGPLAYPSLRTPHPASEEDLFADHWSRHGR